MENTKDAADMKIYGFRSGRFDKNFEITPEKCAPNSFRTIAELAAKIRRAVENLNDEQLDTPYRPEGWTVRQTVHHVADSHLEFFVRFKLALTEENPTIRPYYEDRWAELADSFLPVDVSMKIIEGVHCAGRRCSIR
jgi:hypothetical protein